MPGVFVGSTPITIVGKIVIGATDVQEVFVGSQKVFPAGAPAAAFVSQWKTDNSGTSNDDQITLPLVASGTYNFDVDWGDGSSVDTITAFDDPEVTHTFLGGAGTFTVTITGTIDGWQFNAGGDRQKITQVSSWGVLKPGVSTTAQFSGCSQMGVTATDTLDTSTMTDMANMFNACGGLGVFDASGFITTSVTTMSRMFNGCGSMTSLDVSGFNTANVQAMDFMFSGCGNLLALDVTNFNTANVTTMGRMFNSLGKITVLDVSGFNTGNCADMQFMFSGCDELVTIDVSGFDTSSVNTMALMFSGCTDLATLDVSGFDTASVTTISRMYQNCINLTSLAMDQAGWDIGNITNMSDLLQGATLDTSNYDSILAAWAAQSPVKSSVLCSFGNSQYTIATAQADRDVLTDAPNSWTLTDGGGI